MAYTTIDDPSVYFQTALWTGNNSSRSITNDGNSDMQPDWVWTKKRSATQNHCVTDSTRGVTKIIFPDVDDAESATQLLTSFDSDGFSINNNALINENSATYVGWQWKAGGGSTSSNNDGSYTSTVQANTTAGFSIVKYGDASSFSASTPATVGHGLGAVPKMIIIKNLDGTRSWGIQHATNGAGKIIYLDLANAVADSSGFDNSTSPTSSVFTVNTLNVGNGNNLEYIAYCFAEIQGYSKIGGYTGNGNADGTFVYTGFRPAWIMGKRSSGAHGWYLFDDVRDNHNPTNQLLEPSNNNAETNDSFDIDILSNGFKLRGSENTINGSGESYIYMAFARHPFVSSKGVPTTAR